MSELKFDKFLPNEDLNPVCEVCKGPHKTSHHDENKEFLNPVCEVCKGPHKTSRHNFEEENINEVK